MTIAQAMSLGVSHQQAGRLKEAEAAYRAILEARPDYPGANHNLGLIALAAGHPQDACIWIARAIPAAPEQAIFRNSLGEALRIGLGLQNSSCLTKPVVPDLAQRNLWNPRLGRLRRLWQVFFAFAAGDGGKLALGFEPRLTGVEFSAAPTAIFTVRRLPFL